MLDGMNLAQPSPRRPPMNPIRAVIPLFDGVYCSAEVLTWTGKCSIGRIQCHVFAPSPVPAWIPESLGDLDPPLDERCQRDPGWPTDGWGTINRRTSVTIGAVGIKLLDCPPSSVAEWLQFDRAVSDWRNLFLGWLAAIPGRPNTSEQLEPGILWTSDEQNVDLSYARYCAGDIWEPEPISRWEWAHAFWHAAEGDSPPIARKLIALATRDAARGDARNAIIHAATAAECALTNGVTRHLMKRHSPAEAEAQMNRYRMLGRRLQFAQELGLSVPDDARESLIEPRNAVVHSGRQFTEFDAWKAVGTASTIVDDFDPLPTHCQEPSEAMCIDTEPEELE